jgi:hypothetical protein
MPSPGISRLNLFKRGSDISSRVTNRNFITKNVRYRGKRVASPANNFDLKFCVIEFIRQ